MANQVTLTFAGEGRPLQQTFADVGQSSQQMSEEFRQSAAHMAERFDHLSGQSSLLSGGIGDVGGALTEAFGEDNPIGQFGAQMERVSAIVMGFTGLMDLALFATNNLKIATLAKAGADRVAAAAQWIMNSALFASPITWIVVAIVALIAVIVLIATKTDWFSRAWRASWSWIKNAASNTWDFIKKIPGWIGNAFRSIGNYISAPFKAAFNYISRAWNNTIGRLSWSVPGWVPFIGGNSISVPNLPYFHTGGIVQGMPGETVVAALQAGERVQTVGDQMRNAGGTILGSDGSRLGDALVELVALAMQRRGGDPGALGLRVRV